MKKMILLEEANHAIGLAHDCGLEILDETTGEENKKKNEEILAG